jgi:ribosome recycling factor
MSTDDILLEAEMSMEKASITWFTNLPRCAPARLACAGENIDVHAYGSSMKLKQLALITTPEPRLLVVQPFDAGTVQDIERALKESKIGLHLRLMVRSFACRFRSFQRSAKGTGARARENG